MISCHDDQVIIAQCTPQGSGALALMRITGVGAIACTNIFAKLSVAKDLESMPTHTIHHGWVVDTQSQHIDEVMFFLMHGPRTFTGQDTVEITCHNNQFIIHAIIQQAIQAGARLAQEGEFSKRSVLNGKIDLAQAEAINELIHAQTQQALKQSLAQLKGSLSSWVIRLEEELIKVLAYTQASFEFLDEEMSFDDHIRAMLQNIVSAVEKIKKTSTQAQHVRTGVRIAIIGTVNAGKSSLFNALLGKERAIVTPIAGTTRDVIEAGVYRDGIHWTLIDTAGLRQADDIIEQEGIRRSFLEAQHADIIILVSDASRNLSEQEGQVYEKLIADYGHKMIMVHNKVDDAAQSLPVRPERILNEALDELKYESNGLPLSTKTGYNLDALEKELEKHVAALFNHSESPFLLNARHHAVLDALQTKLQEINALIQDSIAYELVSIHLTDAIAHLGEFTGKTVSEASMDKIFREFCIGK